MRVSNLTINVRYFIPRLVQLVGFASVYASAQTANRRNAVCSGTFDLSNLLRVAS